jgi:hypothetical protein
VILGGNWRQGGHALALGDARAPFPPTRKRTRARVGAEGEGGLQIGCPEHVLRRLLEQAGFPRPEAVEPVAGTSLGGRSIPWHISPPDINMVE